jgi:hypothetical protein
MYAVPPAASVVAKPRAPVLPVTASLRAVGDAPPRRPAAALPEPATPSGLSAELAAVDRARRALQASDAREALRQLDAYEARFVPPRFEQEATLLRVEALVALGASDQARAIAESFLANEPESTYAQRIRSILGERSTPAPRP